MTLCAAFDSAVVEVGGVGDLGGCWLWLLSVVMGKTKSIDTHNGGWRHDEGRKGAGAPGKKRKQVSRSLGKFKEFTHDEGRRFEQKVPAGQKRMMQMMRAMQERTKQGGGKPNANSGLDTGADSVHPDKAKRLSKAKKKKEKQKQDSSFDPAAAQWLSTANGGRGGLDGEGDTGVVPSPADSRKPLERLPDESMQDYSKRLKEYTRKNRIVDIRERRKKDAKAKVWLKDRKIAKKEKRKARLEASRKRAAKRTAGRSGDTSSDDEAEEEHIRQRNRADEARRSQVQTDSDIHDEPQRFGVGKGWAGQVQAERPPQFKVGDGNATVEATGLGKARAAGFKSAALQRMRAIEEYRKHRGTAGALLLPDGGRVRKAEDGAQEHVFVNKSYDD